MIDALHNRAVSGFLAAFGCAPDLVAFAPGRVNLIGEHTDYNDGFVLPCALPQGTAVALGVRKDDAFEAVALDLRSQRDAFNADTLVPRAPGHWANHVRGIVAGLKESGHATSGVNIAIAGDLPTGAGLSSSASLGVALGFGLTMLAGKAPDRVAIAKTAQWSEHHYVGTQCGIMDQLASACSEGGKALLIDCRDLSMRPVPVPPDAAILIVHSGVRRELMDGAYNERRQQCTAAARHFGVTALRDLDEGRLDPSGLDPVVFRRARHVVSENARTLAAAKALEAGNFAGLGALMCASHASLRDDFQVTVPQVDALVDALNAAMGAEGGARMTGGGFGGCVVAMFETQRLAEIEDAVRHHWRKAGIEPQLILPVSPSGGARVAGGT